MKAFNGTQELSELNLDGRLPPTYKDHYTYPAIPEVVQIPQEGCNRGYCPRSADMEIALEKEFWVYVQNNQTDLLDQWIAKTYDYITGSRTPKGARLHKLIGFGKLMISRSHPLISFGSVMNILGGMNDGQISERADPGEFGIRAFNLVSKSMLGFAAFPWQADQAINELLAMENQYGDWGLEGVAVAAHTLIQVADANQVKRGIELFQRNNEAAVKITSSIAPFKPAGEYYTMGEGFVYLNDFDNADLYFNKAIQFAETNNMPAAQVNIMKDMIADVKENYSRQWKETGPLNKVRLPLAPSMGPKACAFCHTGASFPDSYYKE